MADFEEQAGYDKDTSALAKGLHEQAQSEGLQMYDDTNSPPSPDDNDYRMKAVRAAETDSQPETSETVEPTVEETTEEVPVEEEVSEEVLTADAVIRLEDGREVTARELAEGSLMQADYTRKTQELADSRKQLEGQHTAILNEHQQRTGQLAQLANALQVEINSLNNPAELQQLAHDDPGEYSKRMLQMQHRQQMISAAHQQQQQLDAAQQQARVPYERQALVEKNKAFAESFDSTYQSVGEWVLDPAGGGLSPDIWNGVYDHRFVDIAHKAMLWDKMQREAASEAAPRIREHAQRKATVVRPGVSQPAKSSRAVANEAYKRALADKDAMRTTDGIAAAFLAREKMRSAGG